MLKKYRKEAGWDRVKPLGVPTVTVCFTGLRFNVEVIRQHLVGYNHVELFYDEGGTGFGIELVSKSTEDSYKIRRYEQGGKVYTARVYCSAFVEKLEVVSGIDQRDKIFPLKWDEEKGILRVDFVEFDTHFLSG